MAWGIHLPRVALSFAKNNYLIRSLYRWNKGRRLVKELLADVPNLKSMSQEEYLNYQQQIFARCTLENLSAEDKAIMSSPSFQTYFTTRFNTETTCEISDIATSHSNYFTRQRMLATIYSHLSKEKVAEWEMCDLGGSNGYYSFLAAPSGFQKIDVVDPRPEHEQQFHFIRNRLVPQSGNTLRYILGDIDNKDVKPAYDIMLVQGLLYHLYDHFSFLQKLYNMTR